MKKIISTIIIGIFLFSLASAQDEQTWGYVTRGNCISLTQTCPNCTFVNITGVTYPNKTELTLSESIEMQNALGTRYNYSFCDTTDLGKYIISGDHDLDGELDTWNANFISGQEFSTGEAILYFLFVIIMFGILILMIYFIIVLPSENEKGEGNVMIGIVKLKYLRIVLIAFVYPVLILIFNLLIGLSTNFVSLPIFAGIFGFLFEILLRAAWIYTVVIIIWIFYLLVQDSNFKKLIKKMGNPLNV